VAPLTIGAMRNTTSTTRRRRRAAVAVGAALAAVAVPAGVVLAVPAEGLSCGATVTTDVRLTADLVDCAGPGLVIGASGIEIDLDGHTIDGTGANAGIFNPEGHDALTIRGGTIREFGQGIDLLESRGSRIDRLRVTANGIGIVVMRGDHVRVERVEADANTFSGIEVLFSEDVTVQRSTVTGHPFGGIRDHASLDSRYERNVVTGNTFFGVEVLQTDGAVLSRNDVSGNQFDGIRLGFWATGVTLERNETSHNGTDGLVIEEAGNTVELHEAFENGGRGIVVVDGTIDGGRNTAAGNAGGDCVGLACG
jgi:parallel beta-helix repeat protein